MKLQCSRRVDGRMGRQPSDNLNHGSGRGSNGVGMGNEISNASRRLGAHPRLYV
jgi:hypothetical protein